MSLKIEILPYSKLSKELQEEWKYHKYNCFLRISHGDEVILFESDSMEPEDVSFYRDLSWIPDALKKVYDLGFEDGKNEP